MGSSELPISWALLPGRRFEGGWPRVDLFLPVGPLLLIVSLLLHGQSHTHDTSWPSTLDQSITSWSHPTCPSRLQSLLCLFPPLAGLHLVVIPGTLHTRRFSPHTLKLPLSSVWQKDHLNLAFPAFPATSASILVSKAATLLLTSFSTPNTYPNPAMSWVEFSYILFVLKDICFNLSRNCLSTESSSAGSMIEGRDVSIMFFARLADWWNLF